MDLSNLTNEEITELCLEKKIGAIRKCLSMYYV